MKPHKNSILVCFVVGLLLLASYLIIEFNSFDARLSRSLQNEGVYMHTLDAAIHDSDSTQSIVKTLWIWLTNGDTSAQQKSLAANSLHLLIIGEWKLPTSSAREQSDFESVFENLLMENEQNNINKKFVKFFRELKAETKQKRKMSGSQADESSPNR
jgi:hypothetical protein